MQVYPLNYSFDSGQAITIGVQPNSRFSVSIYVQKGDETLTHLSGITLVSTSNVTRTMPQQKYVFQSGSSSAPMGYDQDWSWPTITLKPKASSVPSGAYVVVVFEVDANGVPTTDLGRRCAALQPVNGYPPDSNNMALVICRPAQPSAAIAYVIPTATYHAYNSTGGGCFYDDHIHGTTAQWKVSLRRPGGGLGAQLGEPTDPYDPNSPRQQFTHWDAKFIRWLIAQNISCDFYTDIDLHAGLINLAAYKCMLSVGHHEYWSNEMRDAVSRFVQGGGNVAVFSGNTCFRPINFGAYRTSEFMKVVNKVAGNWPNYNETDLLGLSYGFGGGKWGDWQQGTGWINTTRDAIGYTVRNASHWVFTGCGLTNGQTFGDTDRLVGYEVDGIPTTPNGFNVLANTGRLNGWDVGGAGAMGIFGNESGTGPKTKLVFNGGTTDWARILMDNDAAAHAVVSRITLNVLKAFTGQSV